MAKTLRKYRAEPIVTCSAGYFYQQPVGLGRYFSGVAANDNRTVVAGNHGLYAALTAIMAVCALLASLL